MLRGHWGFSMPLTPYEIFIIVLAVIGCGFAVTRATNVSRQAWRAQAAAIGTLLLVTGVGGTTYMLQSNLDQAIGMSATTRHLVFQAGLEYAPRPLLLGVIGTIAFVALLRSSANGDAGSQGSPGNLWSMGMILGTVATFATAAAYIVLITRQGTDAPATVSMMALNLKIAAGTAVVAALGGVWGTLRTANSAAVTA